MKVKHNIKNYTYEKLIEYAIKHNDVVSFLYRPSQHEQQRRKEIDILSRIGCSKKYIINNYSNEFIGVFFEKNKNNEIIFNEEYKKNYEEFSSEIINHSKYKIFKRNTEYKNFLIEKYKKIGIELNLTTLSYDDYKKIMIYDQRLDYILSIFKGIVYEYAVSEFLNKYSYNIIHEEKIISKDRYENEIIISVTYYINISEELKKNILRKKSIYDWCFPLSIEDINFYKDGYCWLMSVAHEEILNIFCKDEEEYKYLKSIGVEFEEETYIPLKSQDLIYKNYNYGKTSTRYF